MPLPSFFQKYRVEVDQELRAVLDGFQFSMYDMLRYHLGWIDERGVPAQQKSGKALRPMLCLLSSEAICGDFRRALPAAAALELVHNFSLIHDDIQDNDRERHNRPTVWAIWGQPQAINAGTAMRILAGQSLLRLLDQGAPAERLLGAQKLLDESTLRLIEGQYLDISFESRVDVKTAEYLTMIEGKTAALIACSFEMGAMLATQDVTVIQSFRNCGFNLGLAFQIMDDLLGIWGDKDKLGKPVGSDIQRKKKTFPIVYACENAPGPARAEISAIYQAETVDDSGRDRVLNILEDVHARQRAQAMVMEYSERARAEIGRPVLPAWARDCLDETINFLTQREF